LDYAAKRSLAKQIRILRSEGKAVLVASHDVEFVALVADRVIEINQGNIVSNQDTNTALGVKSSHPTQISQVTMEHGLIHLGQIEGGRR
jgi:ABC-type Na+ transport system ATPase subunit NatA